MTKPILENLAQEYVKKADFLRIKADDLCELLKEFRVFGISTVLALRNRMILSR
jgi:hypothetical protein